MNLEVKSILSPNASYTNIFLRPDVTDVTGSRFEFYMSRPNNSGGGVIKSKVGTKTIDVNGEEYLKFDNIQYVEEGMQVLRIESTNVELSGGRIEGATVNIREVNTPQGKKMYAHVDVSSLAFDDLVLFMRSRLIDEGVSIIRLDAIAIDKLRFLKNAGLTNLQLARIGHLNFLPSLDVVTAIARRSDINSAVLSKLDEVAENLKAVTLKDFAPEIPDFTNDVQRLVENPNYKNVDGLNNWLSEFKGNADSGFELELNWAIGKAESGKQVHLGYNPRDANDNLVLVNGKPVDVGVVA